MDFPKEFDIHKKHKKQKRVLKKLELATICQKNKDFIRDFNRHRFLASNIGIERQTKHIAYLITIAEFLDKPFSEVTKKT